MNEDSITLKPIYRKEIKIHDWQNTFLGYPMENEFPSHPTHSHYKSLGPNNDVYIPKTSTQEAMEIGISSGSVLTSRNRSVVNFTSYLITDKQIRDFEEAENKNNLKIVKADNLISTYNLSYYKSFEPKRSSCRDAEVPWLMNRIPVNIVDASQRTSNKFLDDHLFEKNPARQCNDYLKQIRKTSNLGLEKKY